MSVRKREKEILESSWLVQRLRKPSPGFLGMKDNPFSFGGGLRNGGLSPEAMDLLRGIWSFDYMGAAEFEWGAVPHALSRIAEAKNLVAFTMTVPLADVPKHWKDKSKKDPEGEATIYVLCPGKPGQRHVEERIREFAKGEKYEGGYELKESTGLARALRPVNEWDTDVCGWLELDNGFLFFTDREMWEKACDLFGVKR